MADLRLVGTTATGDTVPVLVNDAGELVIEEPTPAGGGGGTVPNPQNDVWARRWTRQRLPFLFVPADVAYLPHVQRLVMVGVIGSGARSLWSDDGVTWTEATLPAPGTPTTLCVSEGLNRVVCGQKSHASASFCWSDDGKTWTASGGATTGFSFAGIARSEGDGTWMAVGLQSTTPKVAWSGDGKAWTVGSEVLPFAASSLCWSPDLGLYAIGVQNQNLTSAVATSDTGQAWTLRAVGSGGYDVRVAWDGLSKRFHAAARGLATGDLASSANGVTWQAFPSGSTPTIGRVQPLPAAGLTVAFPATGAGPIGGLLSTDGVAWQPAELRPGVQWIGAAYHQALKRVVAVGYSQTTAFTATLQLV